MTGKIIEKDVNDLQEEYFENGVVVIKNAIKSYWIGVLQEAIELQLKKNKRYFDNRNMRMELGGFKDFCHNSRGKPYFRYC